MLKIAQNRIVQIHSCIVSLAILGTLGICSTSTVMASPASQPITLVMSRNAAYYLGNIPPQNTPDILSFDWNVTLSNLSNVTASIQFSHNNSTWSNLNSFEFFSGDAQGRQPIDAGWAVSGVNYLRVSCWVSGNQLLSGVLRLEVFANYGEVVLLVLSPFVVLPVLIAIVHLRRKRNRQSPNLTQ